MVLCTWEAASQLCQKLSATVFTYILTLLQDCGDLIWAIV